MGASGSSLEKYIFICSCSYDFFVVFFTINNEHIHKSFFKDFALVFTIPFSFLQLVENLSTTGF